MNNTFKKAVTFVIAVSIILSAVSFVFGVTAKANEPELPENYGVLISKDGVDTTFGDKYNKIATNTKIALTSPVDLSKEEAFEFDIYIENLDAFNNALDQTEEKSFGFYFGSSTRDNRFSTQNYAHASINDQFSTDKWNHIKLSKSDFTEKNIDWSKVKYVFLKFDGNDTSEYPSEGGDISNKDLKLRNICSGFVLPAVSDNDVILYEGLTVYNTNDTFEEKAVDNANLKDCSYIGINLKISDTEKLRKAITDKKAKIILKHESGEYNLDLADNITGGSANGWSKIKTPLEEKLENDIIGVRLQIEPDDNITLTIANIFGINLTKPYSDAAYGEKTVDFGVKNAEITIGEKYKDFGVSKTDSFSPVQNSEFLEFDFYCDDYDSFKKMFSEDKDHNSISATLKLSVSNGGEKAIVFKDIQKSVAVSGWNHIVLSINSAESNTLGNAAATEWKLFISGADDNNFPATGNSMYIDDLCFTKYVKPQETNQYGKVSAFPDENRQWIMGSNFGSSIQNHLATAVDLSSANFVEMDFYVQNYDGLMKAMEPGENDIEMRISSSQTNYDEASRTAAISGKLLKSGWNHICIPFGNFIKGSTSGWLKTAEIYSYRFFFGGNAGASTDNINGHYLDIVNICGTEISVPTDYTGINTVVEECGFKTVVGTYGKTFGLNMSSSLASPIDLSQSSFIEFDLYVDNYENFMRSFTKDANDKDIDVTLNFGIGRTTAYSESLGYFQWERIEKQVKNDGWNHISLAFGGHVRSNANPGEGIKTRETVQNFKVWYGGDEYKNNHYENIIGSDLVIIANVKGTAIVEPELPDNVLLVVGKENENGEFVPAKRASTLGPYFHFATDKWYQNKIPEMNFKGTGIECDVYIDDLDALHEMEATSKRHSVMSLFLSSTPANLWSQYSRPDQQYSAYVDISSRLTHNGWNHIRVGKADFTNENQTLDWTHVTGWQMRFYNGSNVHPETNPNPDVYMVICNIVNTGVISELPDDPESPEKPDKNAVYISSAESTSDSYGTWNPSLTLRKNTANKSEGTASIKLSLNYKSDIEDAIVYYLFDDAADMSDLKTLKFDLFVDLPQLLVKGKNKAEIVLTDKRKIGENYYKWNLDTDNLKQGWNSISLDVSKIIKHGNISLSEIKNIALRFTELDIDENAFGEIVIGLDNLRYLSNNGNTTLKIVGATEDFEDDAFDDGGLWDDDTFDEFTDDTSDPQTASTSYDPIIKNIKSIKTIISDNYLVFAISAGSTLLLCAGAVVLILLIKKKQKGANRID